MRIFDGILMTYGVDIAELVQQANGSIAYGAPTSYAIITEHCTKRDVCRMTLINWLNHIALMT